MATEYTDVDKLILGRWQDVMALFDAHEELQDRVEEVVEEVGERLGRWLDGRGYSIRTDSKTPVYVIGKDDWYHKRKDDWLVFFEIGGFAPFGFRKVKEDNPYAWLQTYNLEFLKIRDAERIEFAKGLRQEVGDAAKNWSHKNVDDADGPLGRYFTDIKEEGRVELIADADKLFDFATMAFGELQALADPIDSVLARFRPKE